MELGEGMKLNDKSYIFKDIHNFIISEPSVLKSNWMRPVQAWTDTDINLMYM